MKNLKWLDGGRVQIEPPKRTKKITATRFATVLGLNPWCSPFECWCAVTKTWEKPFEDTIYTLAGKTIEGLQIEYMRKAYFMDNLRTPTDLYGEDYFNKTWGDFFPDQRVLGGMFDSLLVDDEGRPETVIEFKTTKRAEDWQNDVPEYYALQAALYAWLLGVDNVIMVASFLEDKDYKDPSQFTPNVNNTITVEFKVSERYPDFAEKVATVDRWWDEYIETGISPVYDEKKDAEILKALRTNSLNPDTDISEFIAEAEVLKKEIDDAAAKMKDKEKRLKKLNDIIKEHASKQFRDGDKKVEVKGANYIWSLARTDKNVVTYDDEALKADGVFEKYTNTTTDTSYRMTVSAIKKEDK